MLVLDATNKSITVTMATSATTTNPDFVAAWSDDTGTSFTEGASDGALNGSSQVTLVASPAASTRRLIKSIYIENRDTVANTITVTYNNGGTLRNISKVTLQVGDTWSTDGTTDTNGNLKTIQSPVSLTSGVTGTLPVLNGGTGVTTSTGTGNTVLSTSPTLVTPILGTPTSGTLTSCTGYTTANLSGTITNAQLTNSTISGISLGNNLATLTIGSGLGGTSYNGSSAVTITNSSPMTYPSAGIGNSTGSAWGTSYTTSGSGTVLALNNTPSLTNPTVTNYVETLYSANTSTAITVALTNGTVQLLTLTGSATITMPTAVAGKSFIIMLKQDATGSRTVTWTTVVWGGGTAPTITATASKMDIYSFFSDGTNWYGATIGQNY